MTKRLTYYGSVLKAGELRLPKIIRSDVLRLFHRSDKDTPIKLIIERKKKTRSIAQNRYYWGVIIKTLHAHFSDWSPGEWTREAVHALLKEKFLPGIYEMDRPAFVVPATGEQIQAPYTTTALSTTLFAAYVDSIIAWAWNDLEIFIDPPSEPFDSVEKVDINKQV